MSDLQYSANFEIPKSVLRAEGLNKSFRKKQAVRRERSSDCLDRTELEKRRAFI